MCSRGAVTSVGSAVVKDVYEGRKREAVLAGEFAKYVLMLYSWSALDNVKATGI